MKIKPKRVSDLILMLLFSLAVVLTCFGSLFAQAGSTGAISGTVKDEKGAAVAGAQVEIINAATGVTERTASSDSNGNFGVTSLPPVTYKIVTTAPGFSKTELP